MIKFKLFNNFNTKKKIALIALLIVALLFILVNYNRDVIKSYILSSPSIKIPLINIAKVAIPLKNLSNCFWTFTFYDWTINEPILSFNSLYVSHDNLLFRLHVSYTWGRLSNWKPLESLVGSGARNGARTRDNRNHNPGLYQLFTSFTSCFTSWKG